MSVNGCIIPGTPIAVDFWHVKELNAADFVFFLTHLHGDHIIGLTSTWQHPIYCSELTAKFLTTQCGVERSLLRPLEVGCTHLVPVPSNDDEDASYIAVSVIDANHCPGSVMFLFEGSFGKILHTGDFRYKSELIENSVLHNHRDSIDVIYLDNTFCSSRCIFPAQHEARKEILDIIQQHRDCNVVLGMRKLGKEILLAWLGLTLKEWISVPGQMYSRIQTLGLPNVFRICDKSVRIRVEPFHLVSKKMLGRWNEVKRTIAILPTAIYTGIGGTPYANQNDVFVVPYSDHSSYSELLEFVSKLRPCAVVPIVSSTTRGPFGVDISSRADMSCFGKYFRTPVDGVTSRRALRPTSKAPSILLPVPGADLKRKSLKRKRSIGHRKVNKGIQYVSEDEDSDGKNLQDSCSYERVNPNMRCNCSVVSSLKTRKHADCQMKKLDSEPNITSDVSKDENCLKIDPSGDIEKPDLPSTNCCCICNDKFISKGNIINDVSKDENCLKIDPSGDIEKTDLPSTNCCCICNDKLIPTFPVSLPNCDVVKHVSDLCNSKIFQNGQLIGDHSITEKSKKYSSHNKSCLQPLPVKISVETLSSKFNMQARYTVKSLVNQQAKQEHGTKALVLVLEKWFSHR
ncbi:5' exonuclease Apollo-like [Gigantopelta aegis]|uniref:5' exonuclease Apollo-like n=1 Tax=Gigantopelta aegis TaxID=1735272 RepID=UPI001B88CC6C|nr:5' exonuclease Apollo-like [Gigantopelta aegis]